MSLSPEAQAYMMARTEALVNEIEVLCTNYVPNPDVLAELQNRHLVTLIGIFAVGKTTVMQEVCGRDKDFGLVGGFTTRDKQERDGENPLYRFYLHNPDDLEPMKVALELGNYVQCTVHPTTRRVYGSVVRDYQKPYSILDTMASAMSDIRQLPFRGRTEVTLVAVPNQWKHWVEARLRIAPQDNRVERLAEAVTSLEWSLDQPEMNWLVNRANQVETTAQNVIALSHGERGSDPVARQFGEQLLKIVREMQAA